MPSEPYEESSTATVTVFLLSDTHLGFDLPQRARSARVRRGHDFSANYRRVVDQAVLEQPDLLVHAGDFFYRSRPAATVVHESYNELMRLTDAGIPAFIVPGNHERSRLPPSLLLHQPDIHVFDRPATYTVQCADVGVAVSGFPFARRIGPEFAARLAATGWRRSRATLRLLCLHQTVSGAETGPSGYRFWGGPEVLAHRAIPQDFHAVLSGHMHKHQILTRDGAPPVIYSGSTERTSFAERAETKGYVVLRFAPRAGSWGLSIDFRALDARPMVMLSYDQAACGRDLLGDIEADLRRLSARSIVRLNLPYVVDPATRAAIRALIPGSMVLDRIGEPFRQDRRRASRQGMAHGSLPHLV